MHLWMQCNFLGYCHRWNQCISILTICHFNIYKRQIWDYICLLDLDSIPQGSGKLWMKAYISFLFHIKKFEKKFKNPKIWPKAFFVGTKFVNFFTKCVISLEILMDFNKWSIKWKVMMLASYSMQNFWFFFFKKLVFSWK